MRRKTLVALIATLSLVTATACGTANLETSVSGNQNLSDSSNSSIFEDGFTPEIPDDSGGDSSTEPSAPSEPNTPDTPSEPSTPSDSTAPSNPNETPSTGAPPTESIPEETPKPTTQQYIRCTGDNVNIRSGAGTNFTILGTAEKDTMYAITGKIGNWYQTYYRGKTAYVYTEYAAVFTIPLSNNDEAEKVISEGYKHIGVPYVYGAVRLHDGKGNLLKGFTAQKFDCSSLVQYVYYQAVGKLLDVTTRTQFKQGQFVAGNDLQRGDCIYFTNESRQHLTGIERVGHVAIYLGNNYILHTASDYARIEKMSQQRWDYYLEARRFV